MRAQRVRVFNYGADNRQYLYMKSLYLPDNFGDFAAQSAFDYALQNLDLFDFSNYGPNANLFDDRLRELGCVIDGFEIRQK